MNEEFKNTINAEDAESNAASEHASESAQPQVASGGKKSKGAKSILEGSFLVQTNVVKFLPFILFLTFLAVIYIYNSNFANKTVVKIAKLKKQNEEYRYDYVNTRALLMQLTTQSEIADRLKKSGLKETKEPAKKIIIEVPTKNLK